MSYFFVEELTISPHKIFANFAVKYVDVFIAFIVKKFIYGSLVVKPPAVG